MHEKINEIYGYLHGLWRYRWSALLIAWIVGVLGWLAVYAMPDTYIARTTVHIDTSSIMKPLLKGLAMETDPEEQLLVMTRVLLSRENLLAVMRKTDMDLAVDTPEQKEKMVEELAGKIRMTSNTARNRRGPQASIYEISYPSHSPDMAYKVVSTLLNTLIEDTLNSGRTDTVMAQNFLTEQIAEYERRLADSEKRMAEFKKKNIGFMPDERGGYYTRLQKSEEKIAATKSELRLAKQRHAELRSQLSGSTTVDSSMSVESAAKLRNYQDQLDDLLMQFTDEHPDVQAMRARIARLKANMGSGSAGGGTLDQTSVLYQELKIQESQARIEVGKLQIMLAEQQRSLEELQESIDIIPQVESDLAQLDRDYQLTKERYLRLVERRESAKLAQQVEQNSSEITFKVVDAPVKPLIPAAPNRPLLLAGVLVVALAAGAAWSVLMFLLFPTFVDFKQLRKAIDLPVLGTVSLQMTDEQTRHRKTQLTTYLLAISLLFGVFGGVLLLEKPGSAQVRALITEIGIYL